MTLSYRSTQVQAPTAGPVSGGGPGIYWTAHRRINLDGNHSLWAETTSGTALPAAITPEAYADPSTYLRDEILVSEDMGATWRIVPRAVNGQGALAVPAFDSAWTATSNVDTQNSVIATLSFGQFSATESPNQDFFIYNLGTSVSSITFNVLDTVTQEIATQFAGLIQIELLGTFTEFGNGNPDPTYDSSFIWTTPSQGLNTFRIVLGQRSYVQIRATFVNFPAGGLLNSVIDLGLEAIADKRKFPLPLDALWSNGSRYVTSDFEALNLITVSSALFTVQPFALNVNGSGIYNLQPLELTANLIPPINASLRANQDGNIKIVDSTLTLPNTEIEIANFDYQDVNTVTNIIYTAAIRSTDFGFLPPSGGTIGRGLFVANNISQELVPASVTGTSFGVSMFTDQGTYTRSGFAWVLAGAAITVGDNITNNASGEAIVAVSDPLGVAIESAGIGEFFLAEIQLGGGGAGGGASVLNDLLDVDLTVAPTDGQYFVYDFGSSTWQAETFNASINDLSDVNAGVPSNGETLLWNTISGEFQAGTPQLSINQLIDVTSTVEVDGDVLVYEALSNTYVNTPKTNFLALPNLQDVDSAMAPANNQILQYNLGAAEWEATSPSVDDLSDVDTTTTPPSINQALAWDGSNFVPTTFAGGVTAITDLSDVDTTTTPPSVSDVLEWDGSNWVPGTPAGGGGGGEWTHVSTTVLVAAASTVSFSSLDNTKRRWKIVSSWDFAVASSGWVEVVINSISTGSGNYGVSQLTVGNSFSNQQNGQTLYHEDFTGGAQTSSELIVSTTSDTNTWIRWEGLSISTYFNGFNISPARARAEGGLGIQIAAGLNDITLDPVGANQFAIGSRFELFSSDY